MKTSSTGFQDRWMAAEQEFRPGGNAAAGSPHQERGWPEVACPRPVLPGHEQCHPHVLCLTVTGRPARAVLPLVEQLDPYVLVTIGEHAPFLFIRGRVFGGAAKIGRLRILLQNSIVAVVRIDSADSVHLLLPDAPSVMELVIAAADMDCTAER